MNFTCLMKAIKCSTFGNFQQKSLADFAHLNLKSDTSTIDQLQRTSRQIMHYSSPAAHMKKSMSMQLPRI